MAKRGGTVLERGGKPEFNEVLTPREAAEFLHLSLETVRRLLRSGQLPGRKVGPRQWRIRRGDLDDYLRGNQPPSS